MKDLPHCVVQDLSRLASIMAPPIPRGLPQGLGRPTVWQWPSPPGNCGTTRRLGWPTVWRKSSSLGDSNSRSRYGWAFWLSTFCSMRRYRHRLAMEVAACQDACRYLAVPCAGVALRASPFALGSADIKGPHQWVVALRAPGARDYGDGHGGRHGGRTSGAEPLLAPRHYSTASAMWLMLGHRSPLHPSVQ